MTRQMRAREKAAAGERDRINRAASQPRASRASRLTTAKAVNGAGKAIGQKQAGRARRVRRAGLVQMDEYQDDARRGQGEVARERSGNRGRG